MAPADAGETEYESDPEELERSLTARRREASDDDSDGDEIKRNPRAEVDSDLSDDQIATVEYDNDENKSGDEDEDSYEDDEEEGGEYREDGVDDVKRSDLVKVAEQGAGLVDGEEDEKEKKSATVPTGGAFYMHDDRFQEAPRGRSRTRGGRRLWGSGDGRKWGHDKFEEMNTQEKPNDQRTPRGRFRGPARGRGRGQDRGYNRGSSSKASTNNGQQIFVPKASTQERGPRKYETPPTKGNQVHSAQNKQLRNSHGSQNSHEKMPHSTSRRSPTVPAKAGNVAVYVKKNVVGSNLSSASPPFYPSMSSGFLVPGIQVGMEKLNTNDSAAPSINKYGNTKSVFSPVVTAQTFQTTSQGRGPPATEDVLNRQSHSQGDRFSSPKQLNGASKGTGQNYIRPPSQGINQRSAGIRSLSSSPQKTSSSRNQYSPGEIESALGTGASTVKGKGTLQPSGTGTFMYSGSQVMGRAESLASGDNSNFPAFLPVMQFGGQHGGVPTFGMAYPGYVQSENGDGNREMTWMPVLTGTGALGASFSPPYAGIDGLPSSAGSSMFRDKESSTNNLDDLEKPMERPEDTENGVPQSQSSNQSTQPRRYSNMSFTK